MGLFDTIHGLLKCPYCGNEAFVSFQTKGLSVTMEDFMAGGKVLGGPYLNGEYGRHWLKCENCGQEYLPVAIVKNQVITGLKAYRRGEVPSCGHLPEDVIAVYPANVIASELSSLIAANLIGLLVDERVAIQQGKFSYQHVVENGYNPETDRLRFDLPGSQVARLYDYVRLLCRCPNSKEWVECCLEQLVDEGLDRMLGQLRINYPLLDDLNIESLRETIAQALPVAREILQRFVAVALKGGKSA